MSAPILRVEALSKRFRGLLAISDVSFAVEPGSITSVIGPNGADSPIKGKFDVTTLPAGSGEGARSAATLGGWNLAVSKYSENPEAAIELVKWIASPEMQKYRVLKTSNIPTIQALYDDADIAREQPIIPRWKDAFLNAVPRPSAPTKVKYNEASSQFWTAVHNTLSGEGTAADNLAELEVSLTKLQGAGW